MMGVSPNGQQGPHVLVESVEVPVVADDDRHHLGRVLRLRDGDSMTIGDGAGRWRPCRWGPTVEPTGDVVEVPAPSPRLGVAFALIKGGRPELVVQKLVELGIDDIRPFAAERSVVRWDAQRRERGRARLERIVTSAMEQSRRVHTPVLRGPVPAAEVLSVMPIAEPGGRAIRSDDVALAIGPEGGWSDAERAAASDMVDLGAGVLRVETAALVAATLMLACGQRP